MKLYLPYLILQQEVVSVATIEELSQLGLKLELNIEVKWSFSTFSNLVWNVTQQHVQGTLNAHLFTSVSTQNGVSIKTFNSPPSPIHFEATQPRPIQHLEQEIIYAIQLSLRP